MADAPTCPAQIIQGIAWAVTAAAGIDIQPCPNRASGKSTYKMRLRLGHLAFINRMPSRLFDKIPLKLGPDECTFVLSDFLCFVRIFFNI